ncbi:MAG: hypothetical protein H0V07_09815 [Propionibacteriales bacterium]|nr:hypothetical protein [Propionibacteriales bacterium]
MTVIAAIVTSIGVAVPSVTESTADPGCQVSEVARLLWTMIALAAAASVLLVVRPRWPHAAGLVAADLLWMWIDMEGPVLVSAGSHGIHLADVPVLLTVPALVMWGVRQFVQRHNAQRSSG